MHALVYGRVHGVGFRASTKRLADALHLTGFVRNLDDGTVEICAAGDQKNLEKLLDQLKAAFGNYIQRIESSYTDPLKTYAEFTLIF